MGKSCNQQVFIMIRPSSGFSLHFVSGPHYHMSTCVSKRYVPETHTSLLKVVRRMSFIFHVWDIVFVWSATLLFKKGTYQFLITKGPMYITNVVGSSNA